MIKYKGYTLYVDKLYNCGLFDLDEAGNLSRVLKLFNTEDEKDKVRLYRFIYSNKELDKMYRLATEEDLAEYGCFYFDEDGSRPFKAKICETCERYSDCFLKDSDMRKYEVKCYENN